MYQKRVRIHLPKEVLFGKSEAAQAFLPVHTAEVNQAPSSLQQELQTAPVMKLHSIFLIETSQHSVLLWLITVTQQNVPW